MSKKVKPRRVARITRNMLNMLEHDGKISQRHLSEELGIALGATNAYIQKCMTQGWIQKQGEKSCRGYKITSKGLIHKRKLSLRCLRNDLNSYKNLRNEIYEILQKNNQVYVCGTGPLSDMVAVCALEIDGNLNRIKSFVQKAPASTLYMGVPIIEATKMDKNTPIFFTCLQSPLDSYQQIMLNQERTVLIPEPLKEIALTGRPTR